VKILTQTKQCRYTGCSLYRVPANGSFTAQEACIRKELRAIETFIWNYVSWNARENRTANSRRLRVAYAVKLPWRLPCSGTRSMCVSPFQHFTCI